MEAGNSALTTLRFDSDAYRIFAGGGAGEIVLIYEARASLGEIQAFSKTNLRATNGNPEMARSLKAIGVRKDPNPGQLASPNTLLSKYVYCANNPIIYTDPSGKIFGWDDLLYIV